MLSFGSKIKNVNKRRLVKNVAKLVLIVLVIALLISVASNYFHAKKFDKRIHKQADTLEKRYSEVDQKNLKNKDYDSYQYNRFNSAAYYIQAKDFRQANSILEEVQNNVPASKLSTDIYIYRAEIADKQGDTSKYKQYTESLISELSKQKRTSEAQYYIDQLKNKGL
ncbi:MAG: hypothetical protein AAB436_00695 [Patescibacteria group bacterium]